MSTAASRRPLRKGRLTGGAPLAVAAYALIVFAVFALTANYSSRQIPDNTSVLLGGWSLSEQGSLDLSAYPGGKPWTVLVDGHIYSDRAPGLIAWTVPFFALFGSSYPTVYPAAIAATVAATIACTVLFTVFRRLAQARVAWGAGLLAAFGTSTWTVSADAVWPQGPAQMLLALMMLALTKNRLWWAGLAAGLAVLVRPTTAIAIAAIGVVLALSARSGRPLLRLAAGGLSGLAALLVYNRLLFGVWTVAPGSYGAFVDQVAGQNSQFDPTRPETLLTNVLGALVSPTRGVLVLSPFLLVLLPGLWAAWQVAPAWVRASGVGGVIYAVGQVYANNFSGGSGFYGYRYTLESLTLLAPMLVLCWTEWTSRTRGRRWAFAICSLFAVTQHALGAFWLPQPGVEYENWADFLAVSAWRQASTTGRLASAVMCVIALLGTLFIMLRRGNRTAVREC